MAEEKDPTQDDPKEEKGPKLGEQTEETTEEDESQMEEETGDEESTLPVYHPRWDEDYDPIDIMIEETDPDQASKKLDLLLKDLDFQIDFYTKKRNKNRRPAFIFKLLTTGLSAVVTVLLGIKIGEKGQFEVELQNLALIISAFMALVSAWGSFFDYNELWVKYTVMVYDLEKIRDDALYLKEGNDNIKMKDVALYKKRYNEVLTDVADFIHKVRSDDTRGKG